MREFGHLFDEGLRKGLRAFPNPVPGKEECVECYNLRPSPTCLLAHERIGETSFSDLTDDVPPELEGLRAYWKLDESDFPYRDSLGFSHFSNNLPDLTELELTPTTGRVNGGVQTRQVNASSVGSLGPSPGASATHNTQLVLNNTDYAIVLWAKFNALPSFGYSILRKQEYIEESEENATNMEWKIRWYGDAEGSFGFRFERANGTGTITNSLQLPVTSALNNWYMLYLGYNKTTQVLKAKASSVTHGYNAFTLDSSPGFPQLVTGTRPLILGANNYLSEGSILFTYDEIGIWGRELSNTELQFLWNTGLGKSYPFV